MLDTPHDTPDDRPLTVSVERARQLSGLGNTTLWLLIKKGRLQVVRIGGRTLISMSSLERLLAPPAASTPQARRRGRPPKARAVP